MDNTLFVEICKKTLEAIYDSIEESDKDGALDCELINGIVTIDTEDGQQYVINKHEVSQQIWLSSPKSGASHFSYDAEKTQWISSGGQELYKLLSAELPEFIVV